MGAESALERAVARDAHTGYGVESLKFTPLGETGIPDRWFLIPGGRPFLIEFKAPGEEPKPKQDYWIAKLRRLGYDVEVHDTYEGALEAIVLRLRKALA